MCKLKRDGSCPHPHSRVVLEEQRGETSQSAEFGAEQLVVHSVRKRKEAGIRMYMDSWEVTGGLSGFRNLKEEDGKTWAGSGVEVWTDLRGRRVELRGRACS